MRAKNVNENINFERGSDPKSSMGIGRIAKAKNLLDEIYKNHKLLTYSIKSADQIEIFYNERARKTLKEEGEDYMYDVWVFRFVEKDRFFSKQSKHYDSDIDIWETKTSTTSDPDNIGFREKYLLSMDHKEKEKMEIILKSLNDHYGKIGGLEIIERKNES